MEDEGHDDKRFKRTYKACLNCRTRKVKCDLGPLDSPHDPPCARCKRERKECIFVSSKRGSIRNDESPAEQITPPAMPVPTNVPIPLVPLPAVSVGRVPTPTTRDNSIRSDTVMDSKPIPSPVAITSELTTMQGALVFLAKAAGSVAQADSRDNVDAGVKYDQIESHTPENKEFIETFVRPHGSKRVVIPPVEKMAHVRPKPSKTLSDIEYIGQYKMLTEQEAERLINLFFLTMHPFFPHIPLQLHNPSELAKYPILLCSILTIASRYHPLADTSASAGQEVNKHQGARNVEIHERLWVYCQRLISQTVWAEASTRSLGTVLAFLLFTEWNPRAIHWRWSDYANRPAENPMTGEESTQSGNGLTGLGAMRRSDRMSWMLTGSAVRLAQDMGFMMNSSKIFVAAHVAETNTAMNMNQRSILAQSLSEISLNGYDEGHDTTLFHYMNENPDIKARLENLLGSMGKHISTRTLSDIEREFLCDEMVLGRVSDEEPMYSKADDLKLSFKQRAKIELLRIMSIGYETIYCGKIKLNSDQRQSLAILSILSPLIESWYNTYKKLLKPSNPKNYANHCQLSQSRNLKHVMDLTESIDRESLICDYYYCQLYIYSLALQSDTTDPASMAVSGSKLRLDEITKAARYVELAYNAAKEILNAATRVHKLKMLKYMPVRWCTRIVRSVAFVVKCYLTLTSPQQQQAQVPVVNADAKTILTLSVIPTEEIIQTIQRAALTLREASVDELHLCTRYSTILMYLCAEMKSRTRTMGEVPKPTSIKETESDGESEEQVETAGVTAVPATTSTEEEYTFAESVLTWFKQNEEIGLDFVEPWTEMIEQNFMNQGQQQQDKTFNYF